MVHAPVGRGHELREEMMDSPVVRTVLDKAPLAEHANARDERMRSPGQDDGMLPPVSANRKQIFNVLMSRYPPCPLGSILAICVVFEL